MSYNIGQEHHGQGLGLGMPWFVLRGPCVRLGPQPEAPPRGSETFERWSLTEANSALQRYWGLSFSVLQLP